MRKYNDHANDIGDWCPWSGKQVIAPSSDCEDYCPAMCAASTIVEAEDDSEDTTEYYRCQHCGNDVVCSEAIAHNSTCEGRLRPIPTKATGADFERYVANIIVAWRLASDADMAQGRAWYHVAHDLADILGDGDTRKGAGVIAALSPQQSWERNCALAQDAVNGDVHGTTGRDLAKVRAILDGADPEDVLPMSKKTGHFYRNIADPTDPDPVTIDRHAHDIAVGARYGGRDRGLGCASRYAILAHAYREAARRLGELPCTVQAVTWVFWRRQFNSQP